MRIVRGVVLVVLVLAVLAGAGVTVLAVKQPAQRPAPTEVVERTPQRLERGKYLAEVLAGCMDCHSDHDDTKFAWPAKAGTYGQGGFAFDRKLGFPGTVCAQNITPDPETGLGS